MGILHEKPRGWREREQRHERRPLLRELELRVRQLLLVLRGAALLSVYAQEKHTYEHRAQYLRASWQKLTVAIAISSGTIMFTHMSLLKNVGGLLSMSQNFVEFSKKPPRYEVRPQPNRSVIISFYDEIECVLVVDETEHWRAVCYELEFPVRFQGLEERIDANYSKWLDKAKAQSHDKQIKELSNLSQSDRLTQIESAIMELAELSVGGE